MAEHDNTPEVLTGDLKEIVGERLFAHFTSGEQLNDNELVAILEGRSDEDRIKIIYWLDSLGLLPFLLTMMLAEHWAKTSNRRSASDLRIEAALRAVFAIIKDRTELSRTATLLLKISDDLVG